MIMGTTFEIEILQQHIVYNATVESGVIINIVCKPKYLSFPTSVNASRDKIFYSYKDHTIAHYTPAA